MERLATCYPRHKQAEDEDTESLKRDNVDVRDKTATSAESAGEDLTAPNKPVSSPPSAIVTERDLPAAAAVALSLRSEEHRY